MLWLKAFHIISIVAWFAGLFYLPRLFVYHADAKDFTGAERFKIMERRLFYGIMLPAAILSLLFGIWLVRLDPSSYIQARWFHAKLISVALLMGFHLYCGKLIQDFKQNRNRHTSLFYRCFNEIPTVLLVVIVVLTVVKPF